MIHDTTERKKEKKKRTHHDTATPKNTPFCLPISSSQISVGKKKSQIESREVKKIQEIEQEKNKAKDCDKTPAPAAMLTHMPTFLAQLLAPFARYISICTYGYTRYKIPNGGS